MKRLTIIVVLLILIPVVYFQHDRIERLIGPTETIQPESVKIKDLVERDGIHYKKFTEVPFTGKITGSEQGSLKDGKKDGPWVTYWDNGQLGGTGTYKDGKEHGPWVAYNIDGTVWKRPTGTYKNGVKVKKSILFSPSYNPLLLPNNNDLT